MNNEQLPPKSHANSNDLSLLVETDIKKSNGPFTYSRPTWGFRYRKYGPFTLHFTLTVLVAMVCICFLDGRTFNANSRRPQYREVDGSIYHVASYTPLQSDITTAVSLAATVTRVAGGWWASGYIWRSIFVVMERGGISAKGLSHAISYRPPAPRHISRKSNIATIYITLFATFAIDYFSAALTGSFIWEAADKLIPGRVPLTAITRGVSGRDMSEYFNQSINRDLIMARGFASATIAWGTHQLDFSIPTQPSTIFRRAIKGAQYLSANSTLNVVMPYFALEAFEWVPHPHQVLTDEQLPLLSDKSEFNPNQFSAGGMGWLLPDSKWGPSYTAKTGEPHIVSETRLFILRVQANSNKTCPQNYIVDTNIQVNLYASFNYSGSFTGCFAIANMTYRAGAIACENCKIISPTVVEAQRPFSIIGDPLTSMALGLAPSMASKLFRADLFIIPGFVEQETDEDTSPSIIELTSLAYQAAWAALADSFGESYNTTVKIASPALRAKVIRWRVYLWVALHLWVLGLGLLFVYVQSHCDRLWFEDPTMAIFWLDTRAVLTNSDGQRVVSNPWQPGMGVRNDEMLILELDKAGRCSVQVDSSPVFTTLS